MSTTPLTDAINALTQYANETTGQSDTTLSDAVGTLVAGYGGGGGGITPEDVLRDLQPSGDIEFTISPAIDLPSTVFGLNGKPITSLIIHGLKSIAGSYGPFKNMASLKKIVLPDLTATYQGGHFAGSFVTDGSGICILPSFSGGQYYDFGQNNHVGLIDFGANCTRLMSLYRCLNLTKLILRNSNSVVTLTNTNQLNNTPFASGGAGGTLYVPNALISSYQSANNWSTILGYANNSIQAIEGSPYENTNWWVNY